MGGTHSRHKAFKADWSSVKKRWNKLASYSIPPSPVSVSSQLGGGGVGVEYGKAKAAHELILDMRFFPSETLKAVSWIFCYCVRPQDRAGIGAKANAPLLLTCSSQMQCRAPCTLLCLNLEKIWNKRCTKSPSTYNTIAILGDYCNRQACTCVFGGLFQIPKYNRGVPKPVCSKLKARIYLGNVHQLCKR